MTAIGKPLVLVLVAVFVVLFYINTTYLDSDSDSDPDVTFFPLNNASADPSSISWSDAFLSQQSELASRKKIYHTCDFDALKLPIRVQEILSGTGVMYKSFLHPPGVDIHISDIQWFNGVPGHWAFEADYHIEFMKSINRIREIKGQKDLTILDIGANIGVHSMFFAMQGARVHSFEPAKANFRLLQCSAFINGYTSIVANNVALSNETTSGDGWCITTPDDLNQGHKVLTKDCNRNFTSTADDTDNSDGIRTILLDDYWTRVLKKSRADIIKIDIEGHEPITFAGAKTMLKEAPPYLIYSEFQPLPENNNGWDPVVFLQTMWSYGYRTEMTRNTFGFKTINIDDVETAKELVAYVDALNKHYGIFLIDLVFKHRDFIEN